MTLRELQTIFEEDAKAILGDYQSMTKTELANGYCDADDAMKAEPDKAEYYDSLRGAYFSALMLRYWYKIFEWKENSKSLQLEATDFADWLADSLNIAFAYRVWRYEYKAKVSLKENGKFIGWELDKDGNKIPNPYYWKLDPNAPDKIINRCCFSTRGREYQYHNKDKRKANVQMLSLDSMIDDDGDYAVQWAGCVVEDKHIEMTPTYALVKALLGRNELLESLIIDGIANGDSFKEETYTQNVELWDEEAKEYVEREVEKRKEVFDERKLVKYLSHVSEDYIRQFCRTYDVEESVGDLLYKKLKKTNNQKLYKLIEKTRQEVQTNESLKRCLV